MIPSGAILSEFTNIIYKQRNSIVPPKIPQDVSKQRFKIVANYEGQFW